MKGKKLKYCGASDEPLEVREEEGERTVVNVRTARDGLSRLLDQAAQGHEVIITCDGRPKAMLVSVRSARRAFTVDWDLLASMPLRETAPSAEELIREDRDKRD